MPEEFDLNVDYTMINPFNFYECLPQPKYLDNDKGYQKLRQLEKYSKN